MNEEKTESKQGAERLLCEVKISMDANMAVSASIDMPEADGIVEIFIAMIELELIYKDVVSKLNEIRKEDPKIYVLYESLRAHRILDDIRKATKTGDKDESE